MGLFDIVLACFKCPYCGYEEKEHGWQTKSLQKILKVYKAGDVVKIENFESSLMVKEGYFEIHTFCKNCKKFVKARIRVKDSRISENVEYENF
ncbi:MAG: hypothetical protein QXS37_01245 [Candidatus Aenigmatarchaeota archaeon]